MEEIAFDISLVQFEERYDDVVYRTTTLYFIAPKEWLDNRYPEAIHSEISIEFPTNMPEARFSSVMMSPTRLTDDNGSEDYDWFDIELSLDVIEAMIALAKQKNEGVN